RGDRGGAVVLRRGEGRLPRGVPSVPGAGGRAARGLPRAPRGAPPSRLLAPHAGSPAARGGRRRLSLPSGAPPARPRGADTMSDAAGETITARDGRIAVPNHPIIPFIEGDGTGPDIWRAAVRVLDAAVAEAYGGRRAIRWKKVL